MFKKIYLVMGLLMAPLSFLGPAHLHAYDKDDKIQALQNKLKKMKQDKAAESSQPQTQSQGMVVQYTDLSEKNVMDGLNHFTLTPEWKSLPINTPKEYVVHVNVKGSWMLVRTLITKTQKGQPSMSLSKVVPLYTYPHTSLGLILYKESAASSDLKYYTNLMILSTTYRNLPMGKKTLALDLNIGDESHKIYVTRTANLEHPIVTLHKIKSSNPSKMKKEGIIVPINN